MRITRNAVSGAAVNFGHGATLDPRANNLGNVVITRVAGLTTADASFGQNGSNKSIDRIWTVVPTTPPASPVDLTLQWLPDNDNGLTDFTQARIWQQDAVGQPWYTFAALTNASSRSITQSPGTLTRFTVSNRTNPLPVQLTAFTAQLEGAASVRLRWRTASEVNNAGFAVERSLDGRSFADVGALPGAGNSTVPLDYTLLDSRLPAGATLLYYRLRQTDLDGTRTYSPVRTVALSAEAAGFVVYPTRVPAGQAATYLYTGPAGPATLQVYDVVGRLVQTLAADGRAQGEVPLRGLAAGAYFLRYTTATASFGTRCLVE